MGVTVRKSVKRTCKTYVEFLMPGTLFAESDCAQVPSRDIRKLSVPEHAFAFTFFDIVTETVKVGGKTFRRGGERSQVSPKHYYGGHIYTLAEVQAEFTDEHTLLDNMRGNGYQRVIRCRTGNWQPFERGDILVATTAAELASARKHRVNVIKGF
jgi:hypothetical protein